VKTLPSQRPRIDLIDGVIGHLLIGMLVAHLSLQDGIEWLRNFHHHRVMLLYDAEFFVLIAGLLIGHLWVNSYKTPITRRRFVIKRLSTIYRYNILSAVPFYCFALINGAPPIQTTLGVVTMQMGGWYSDILPIYFVCFLLIFPFALAPSINKPILIFTA
jgi:hypothetical protein